MLAEFESEIKRLKALRNDSLVAAERHLDPPSHEIFDQPDNCFGLRIDKLHRRLFNDTRSHDAEAMRLRALQLPLDDPSRIAYLQSRACKYSNTLFSTMPDPFAPFSTPEFRSAEEKNCNGRLFSKNGRMPGGAGRRTSTSFEAINASSATGIPNLVR